MKKSGKLTIIVMMLLALALGLAACNNGEHTHDWGNWVTTTPATESTNGVETRTCKGNSSHTETRPINATGTTGLTYDSNGDTYEVSGYTGTSTSIFIPLYYNNKPVSAIGSEAFKNRTAILSVAFAEGSQVELIRFNGFSGCTNLASITLPESVTRINATAFRDCTSLTSITIPASVTLVENSAFSGWTSSQTIIVKGFSSEAAATTAWTEYWKLSCNAIIDYQG